MTHWTNNNISLFNIYALDILVSDDFLCFASIARNAHAALRTDDMRRYAVFDASGDFTGAIVSGIGCGGKVECGSVSESV